MRDVPPMTGADDAPVAPSPEPTQAEIDDWAARERARREAWLSGPTEDERQAYARRLKDRRLAEMFDEGEQRLEGGMRRGLHAGREGQLAMEGALSKLYRWSSRTFSELVQAGRDWEEETAMPSRRSRVPFEDDAD